MYAINHSTFGVTVAGSSPAHRTNASNARIEVVIASADDGGIDAVIARAVMRNGRTHSGTDSMSNFAMSIVGVTVVNPFAVRTVTGGICVRGLALMWTMFGFVVVEVAVRRLLAWRLRGVVILVHVADAAVVGSVRCVRR